MAVELQTQPSPATTLQRIALAGNPNAGKTTLFNALTGMRQKVGNYPGVTVEKKEGRCRLTSSQDVTILDIPGTYSLAPKSPDEEVARDVLLGLRPDTPVPDAVVVVVDASNLERNLYLATQILDLGIPAVIALNMTDVAAKAGKSVDASLLSKELGVPVVSLVANKGEGIAVLKATLLKQLEVSQPPQLNLTEPLAGAREELAQALVESGQGDVAAHGLALRLLASDVSAGVVGRVYGAKVADVLAALRADAKLAPLAAGAAETAARYAMLGQVVAAAQKQSSEERGKSFTDKADAILTHKFWGLVIFAAITLLVFQAIFSWASIPMDWIDGATTSLGDYVRTLMPNGPLEDLIVKGVIAGVGAVVIFLPQILILFFFIGLLEDTGYMARAAFIMDRLMGKVGLHGRAFIPLMSSFACAIPGIMAARTISSRADRMTTILIAPLMSCSARMPVYILMIATFIPSLKLFGFHIPLPFKDFYIGLTLPALVMFSMFALGVIVAMVVAWILKKTLFVGPPPPLMLELPPYKAPSWRNIVVTMWERGSQFLKRAGTIILAISIVLWFAMTYPKPPKNMVPADPAAAESLELRHSVAGRVGHVLEPVIAPLGYNWKIGVGLIGAMAAREVFVSTMGTVYAVADADEESQTLKEQMKSDRWPDGRPVWTPLTAISLLVYFVIAMQCISTLAVVKRETNSWKWPIFMQVYLTGLAWILAFIVYQGGRFLGY